VIDSLSSRYIPLREEPLVGWLRSWEHFIFHSVKMQHQQLVSRLPRPVPLAPISASSLSSPPFTGAPHLDSLMGTLYPWGALSLPLPRPPFPFYLGPHAQNSDQDCNKGSYRFTLRIWRCNKHSIRRAHFGTFISLCLLAHSRWVWEFFSCRNLLNYIFIEICIHSYNICSLS